MSKTFHFNLALKFDRKNLLQLFLTGKFTFMDARYSPVSQGFELRDEQNLISQLPQAKMLSTIE